MSTAWTGDAMRHEQGRRKSNRDKALDALLAAGPSGLSNVQLMAIAGSRAGSRVQDLRDRGHVITCVHERDAIWRYTLHQPGARDRVQLVDPQAPAPGCLF